MDSPPRVRAADIPGRWRPIEAASIVSSDLGRRLWIPCQRAPPGMVKSDRQTLLEAMEERHDALIDQLDALNAQVELALAACGTTPRAEDAASG